ncbi:MAG: adenosine monophosphate-protein transferase [Dethiosulfovibrio peptidovorans]|nr:MAG: adenosine monophosphate-protein transferase [Dethiosulfovibrio peptidovorans]
MACVSAWHVEDMVIPEGCNIILGQSHFIKTIEDLYEALVTSSPSLQFGIAFCEASGECRIRRDGNADDLVALAVENAQKVASGHTFVIVMRNGFPINVLDRVKGCHEVCRIFAATANPLQVLIAETEQGRGVVGVIDGVPPKGVETEDDVVARKALLRDVIGYKR